MKSLNLEPGQALDLLFVSLTLPPFEPIKHFPLIVEYSPLLLNAIFELENLFVLLLESRDLKPFILSQLLFDLSAQLISLLQKGFEGKYDFEQSFQRRCVH